MNIKQFDPLKILNHWDTLNKIAKGKVIYPITVEIDPSNLCNHDCIWCMYANFKKEKHQIIPKEILFNLIKELGQLGVKSITFTGGGEPLVSPFTVEALSFVKQQGMEVGLVTNGGLMNKKVCYEIIQNCTFLRVSLDAASQDTHNKLHRPKNPAYDNFNKIIKNLKTLIALRKNRKFPTIGIAYLVHPLNYHEIYKAAKLAKNLGVDYIQIRPVFIPGKKVLEKIMPQIQELVLKSLKLSDNRFQVIPILHRFNEINILDRSYPECLAHTLVSVVAADCQVYLCCQLRGNPRFSFGSLKEKSFKQIWHSSQRKNVIRHIDLASCPPCRLNKYNELINYLKDKKKLHNNFL